MQALKPIDVLELFPEILGELVLLLEDLPREAWELPTACAGWTVKDVAAHLLGDELGILSRGRDGYQAGFIDVDSLAALVAAINARNELWVRALRRLSPQLLCELLRTQGEAACAYFATLDPDAMGGPVGWAGPEPAPVWFDLAREYTERWHHQQHIRDAVGRPGLTGARYLAPVLDTFVRALPHTFRNVDAPVGSIVSLRITGEGGGTWLLLRKADGWQLFVADGDDADPSAGVTMEAGVAWRLFTKGVTVEEAAARVEMHGAPRLAKAVLGAVAILA